MRTGQKSYFDYPDIHIPYKEELKQYNQMKENVRYKVESIKKSYIPSEKEYMLPNYRKVKESELTEENIESLVEFGFNN